MLFNSPIFLFLFLPITLLIYYLLPKKFKNVLLLLASLSFYSWGEKELVLIIIASAIVDYSAALIIASGRKKVGLYCSIFFNLGILFYFKYSGFVFSNLTELLTYFNVSIKEANTFANIILPLGISFYTFQTMSYTIDVYRGQVKANKNFIEFATYVTLFPQLIAGPIVRYSQIEKELKSRKTTLHQFSEGIERFIIGLAKKMIIANNCAYLADSIFSLPSDNVSFLMAWLGIIAYSFQIYFDFSGYSDMAIGLGKMFGFNFPENFNYPYISKSIQEFWRRWHITLSHWFKDYLYISLGGNRKGNKRTYINLIIVFFITGLWHGASWTFVIWGLFHGLFLVIERIGFKKQLSKAPLILSHIYVFFVVTIAWVFFRSETLFEAFMYIGNMFNFTSPINWDLLKFYITNEFLIVLVLAIIFMMPSYNFIIDKVFNRINNKVFNKYTFKFISLTILFLISLIYIATDSYNPFIYFRF